MSSLAAAALFLAAPLARQGADWPQWGGPAHNGVVPAEAWSARGAEAPLWSANVGLGYSCPSIVSGHLVTLGYDLERGRDVVVCLNASTGEERWRHEYAAAQLANFHGGGTLTTPAIADGGVYTSNREGHAFALDLADGAVRWERDYRDELDLGTTFHGYAASPLVLGQRLVLAFGGVVAAFDRADGALLWRTADEGDGSYASPVPLELDGRPCVAALQGFAFVVLELATGEELRRLPWEPGVNGVNVGAPVVLPGGRVLLSTAYGLGAALLRLGESREPEVLWRSRALRNKVTGCFPLGDAVYGFDESLLKCVDLAGAERWRVRGLGMGALSIAGDRLLVLSSSGELIVAEARPDAYHELSRRQVLEGGVTWTMPVFVDGLVYVRNSLGDLVCLDHRLASSPADERAPAEVVGPADAPTAERLFDRHRAACGLTAVASARIEGRLEVPGIGLTSAPFTLHLSAPDRWHLSARGGRLVRAFDGELAWEQGPADVWLLEEDAALDAARLLGLDVFAPALPARASVAARPEPFAGRLAWRVDGLEAAPAVGVDAAPVAWYFDVEGGALLGRDGARTSTLRYGAWRDLGGARLPESVTRLRVETGQEETLRLEHVTWGAPAADVFARPPGLARALRDEDARARDAALLFARFSAELGRYAAEFEPYAGAHFELLVEDGDLWLDLAGRARARVDVPVDQVGGVGARRLPLVGRVSRSVSFVRDMRGRVKGMRLFDGRRWRFLVRASP